MNDTARSPLVMFVIGLTLVGCAAQGGAARRSGPGPQVQVTLAACRTTLENGAAPRVDRGVAPLPDAQLCKDIEQSLQQALTKAGYRLASGGEGSQADMVPRVFATQRARHESEGSRFAPEVKSLVRVVLQGTVTAKGNDLDRVVAETEELEDPAKVHSGLAEVSNRLVGELSSSTLRDAKPSPGS